MSCVVNYARRVTNGVTVDTRNGWYSLYLNHSDAARQGPPTRSNRTLWRGFWPSPGLYGPAKPARNGIANFSIMSFSADLIKKNGRTLFSDAALGSGAVPVSG